MGAEGVRVGEGDAGWVQGEQGEQDGCMGSRSGCRGGSRMGAWGAGGVQGWEQWESSGYRGSWVGAGGAVVGVGDAGPGEPGGSKGEPGGVVEVVQGLHRRFGAEESWGVQGRWGAGRAEAEAGPPVTRVPPIAVRGDEGAGMDVLFSQRRAEPSVSGLSQRPAPVACSPALPRGRKQAGGRPGWGDLQGPGTPPASKRDREIEQEGARPSRRGVHPKGTRFCSGAPQPPRFRMFGVNLGAGVGLNW